MNQRGKKKETNGKNFISTENNKKEKHMTFTFIEMKFCGIRYNIKHKYMVTNWIHV